MFGGAIGAAIGAAVGKLVSAICEWVLNEIIDLLIAVWNDDAFPTAGTKSLRPNPASGFSSDTGVVLTKPGMRWVKAHGGKYEIHFDWHLVK